MHDYIRKKKKKIQRITPFLFVPCVPGCMACQNRCGISKKKKRANGNRHARHRAYPCRHVWHARHACFLGFPYTFTGTPPACILLGCRPFSAENCPLDSFPGAAKPLAAGYVPMRPVVNHIAAKSPQQSGNTSQRSGEVSTGTPHSTLHTPHFHASGRISRDT